MKPRIIDLERLCLDLGFNINRLVHVDTQEAKSEFRLLSLKRSKVKDELLNEYRKMYQRKAD